MKTLQCSNDVFGWFSAATSASGHLDSASKRKTTAHLAQEIDATADYEGRDSCANDGEERDGADVLEEVPLKTQEGTWRRAGYLVQWVLRNTQTLFTCKVGHSTGTQGTHWSTFFFFPFFLSFPLEVPADCLNRSQ